MTDASLAIVVDQLNWASAGPDPNGDGHAWPTVAQTQALYGQYVAAEAEAFRRGSYAPINDFAQLPQMRLIRRHSSLTCLKKGLSFTRTTLTESSTENDGNPGRRHGKSRTAC